jgi:hypothetical protein
LFLCNVRRTRTVEENVTDFIVLGFKHVPAWFEISICCGAGSDSMIGVELGARLVLRKIVSVYQKK